MVEKILSLNDFLEGNWPKELKKHSLKSTIINLNARFLKYLNKDGVVIHRKYYLPPDLDCPDDFGFSDDETGEKKEVEPEVQQEDKDDDYAKDVDDENDPEIEFPEFEKDLEGTLDKYDRAVFVKLNWKAPRESEGWVPQLKCQTIGDVFLLLKSSGRLGEMIENIYGDLKDEEITEDSLEKRGGLHLVLRKWYPLNTAREFRVFVDQNKIIAISQRSIQHYFPYLKEKKEQDNIINIVTNFFKESVKPHFKLETYVLDVYIDIPPKNRVWLVDLSPWHEVTNALLFNWEELAELQKVQQEMQSPVFKYIPNETDIYKESYVKFNFPKEMSAHDDLVEIIKKLKTENPKD